MAADHEKKKGWLTPTSRVVVLTLTIVDPWFAMGESPMVDHGRRCRSSSFVVVVSAVTALQRATTYRQDKRWKKQALQRATTYRQDKRWKKHDDDERRTTTTNDDDDERRRTTTNDMVDHNTFRLKLVTKAWFINWANFPPQLVSHCPVYFVFR